VTRYSGCQYINRFTALESTANYSFLDARTSKIVNEERQRQANEHQPHGKARWKQIVVEKVHRRPKNRMEEAVSVSGGEQLAGVDRYNGRDIVNEEQRERLDDSEARKHWVTIEPVVDRRMKDIARE